MLEYLFMLLSAFGLGAAHALEPGHGKTVVAAYLVGSRGRTRDAILLGSVVTLTHTASIYMLVLISAVAAAYLVPGQVQRWFAIGSGLLVVAVGAWMIWSRARGTQPAHAHSHAHPHPHPHEHPHDHDHGHDDAHGHDHGHTHTVGTGSLVALGVSGGMVPCPAALLLIPAAIGLGAVLKGLVLVLSFSLGLALVLIAIGIATLKAAGLAGKWLEREQWTRRISLASACLITALGVALTVKALLGPGH